MHLLRIFLLALAFTMPGFTSEALAAVSGSFDIAPPTGSYGGGTIGDLLCNVAGWFVGSVGQGIATLSIIVLGIGALMGKVSQGTALTTMVGVATIFGAPKIVADLTGVYACYY